MKKQKIFICLCIQLCFVFGENLNCTTFRNKFASASSEFINCSITSSRPISFCEDCVNQYIYILDSYNNMSQVTVNGTPCINFYVNLDRLGIVQSLYDNSVNLWNRAKCYECYVIKNGTQTTIKSNETIMFNDFHESFKQCINNFTSNDTSMCPSCMDKYSDLQNYYVSISNENEKIGVCMDIVDTMNATWIYWNKRCHFQNYAEYVFIGSTIAIFIATVLFYVFVQYCAQQKSPTIVQQSRFAEVINTLST